MGTLAEAWIEQGMEKGIEKGKREGLLQGRQEGLRKEKTNALTRLLERRFGILPEAVGERVGAASLEQLDAWFDAAIDAGSLGEVFGV